MLCAVPDRIDPTLDTTDVPRLAHLWEQPTLGTTGVAGWEERSGAKTFSGLETYVVLANESLEIHRHLARLGNEINVCRIHLSFGSVQLEQSLDLTRLLGKTHEHLCESHLLPEQLVPLEPLAKQEQIVRQCRELVVLHLLED